MITYPDRTQEIYDFIVEYMISTCGLPPTLREIMTACGVGSSSDVRRHLEMLERDGLIELYKGRVSRGIKVIGGEWIPPERKDDGE